MDSPHSEKAKRLSIKISDSIYANLDELASASQSKALVVDGAMRQLRMAMDQPVHGDLQPHNLVVLHFDNDHISLVDIDSFDTSTASSSLTKFARPPKAAFRFLNCISMLTSIQVRDALIGDLEERYSAIVQSEGRRAATRWFWQEVSRSFFSLAFDALKRISGLDKLVRRIGS